MYNLHVHECMYQPSSQVHVRTLCRWPVFTLNYDIVLFRCDILGLGFLSSLPIVCYAVHTCSSCNATWVLQLLRWKYSDLCTLGMYIQCTLYVTYNTHSYRPVALQLPTYMYVQKRHFFALCITSCASIMELHIP